MLLLRCNSVLGGYSSGKPTNRELVLKRPDRVGSRTTSSITKLRPSRDGIARMSELLPKGGRLGQHEGFRCLLVPHPVLCVSVLSR